MADDKAGFYGDDPLAGGSFSRLLFSDGDDINASLGHTAGGIFAGGGGSAVISSDRSPKMLCFGDYQNECDLTFDPLQSQKSGITCSKFSSSTSSTNNGRIKKKRNGNGENEAVERSMSAGSGAPAGSRRNIKKNKSENPAGNGHAKVRKEKLGDRIAALQQLVSPFGKTDTASVLHEATGYVKFLHDQVKVLCSPYLQHLPPSTQPHLQGGGETKEEDPKDLRSRGLCLVPVDLTLHLANNNGADLWSPAAMKQNVSSNQR